MNFKMNFKRFLERYFEDPDLQKKFKRIFYPFMALLFVSEHAIRVADPKKSTKLDFTAYIGMRRV